ncbi:MAG TPA: acyl-CoA dehydrogenase family protein [Longimicrobiales bacterium]|nr:acyl-CoA dehydrogenase family protein [Longimicrobiales bacterium]
MTYSFQPFLDALGENWYDDDPLLRTLLAHHAGPGAADEEELGAWGGEVAGPLRELAEASARPENRPRLRRWDAYGRRVDRIELPASTRRALAEVLGRRGMGAVHGDPHVFYARAYLYAQNGESGVVCSMACTDGLVRALEALGDRPVHRRALERVRSSGPERVWHGAQFVTEIQGGSDVPANRARARPDGDAYRVDGRKWFCSNVNADFFLVTARPGGEGDEPGPVGLFLVPARLDESPGERNGHTIDRLKEKLGTRELATAEVTFRGARAWPVGPLERGLPNLLAHVLVTSRFHCVYWAASALRRAERIAAAYAGFRRAFGAPIADYPLVEEALGRIRGARRRALAATFGLLSLWEEARESDESGADFRVLLSLAKPVLTRRATEGLHEAMAILGGNGIEERFSPLPRLWRDAAIMETWEGPHNVLFTQALRDLERLGIEPGGFLERVAGEGGAGLVDELAGLLARSDEEDVTVPFARLAPRIVDAFAERVLEEAGAG